METKFYPLSDSQKGIYYEWEKDKSLTQYNLAFLYDFPVSIDSERIINAFENVINAHPIIKVKLGMKGEEVVQYFLEEDHVEINIQNVRESEMEGIISRFIRPFDLIGSALYRIELYQTEKKVYVLFDIHHILFDRSSVEIFNMDLVRAYEGEVLTKEYFTEYDYADLEYSRKGDTEYLEAESYFEKRLSGITMTRVPTINNKKNEVGFKQLLSEFIDQDLVNEFCTKLRISPNNLFAGAIGICLNRFTREQEIAFCTVHHGRTDERLLNKVGMFVKTLPVVIKVLPNQKVVDYLADIRTDLLELWSKQSFPFFEMVKKFGASMEVVYTFQKGLAEDFGMEGGMVHITKLSTARTNESLVIYIIQKMHHYEIRCEYNDSLYSQEYIKRFSSCIKNTVLNMMADEYRVFSDISILSKQQEAEVRIQSTGMKLDYDRTVSLVDLFREQVRKCPDSVAVVFEKVKLTYAELDLITDNLAKKLASLGVRREKVVGIMIGRSEFMVIYPLAIMKAGGVYMPLDFTMPADRLSFMIRDAGAGYILSEGSRVADTLPGFKGVVINQEDIIIQQMNDDYDLPRSGPEDSFVLLYTSGSTGTPKGCILEHRNIVNFCKWYIDEFNVTPQDRSVAYANFAFDAHMMDIYPMITVGASVYILPSDMRIDLIRMNQYMEENGLTIAFLTTQIGRQFAEDIENHSLRLLSVGGERLIPTRKPPYRFYNGYGPTECTIYSTFYNIRNDYSSSVIGHPVRNVCNYIMDNNLQLLPIGVAGELCIGGAGVGRGYLNRDDLNKEKFVEWEGEKLYRTGDLARYNESGEIEYFNRLDNQVKLRGLRIELGEIENVLSGYEDITSVVVDVKEFGGVQHLCGYFTAKSRIETQVLKDFMRTSLAEYMVPTALIQMEQFPLTNNGKVNRKLLPDPQILIAEIIPPATPMEKNLFDIVSVILGTNDFGVSTNLFSLGLTSILAIKLSVTIRKKLGIIVETKDILKFKTLQHIARIAAQAAGTTPPGTIPVVEIRDFYPLSENQMGIYCEWEKNPDALQYNIGASLRFSDQIDVKKLKDAVNTVIDAHPYLKTTLAFRDNAIVQLRRDNQPVEILVEENIEMEMNSVLSSFVRPFNLFGDSLYRVEIHQTECYTYFLFDIHHLIFDGGSMNVLFNDLEEAFKGQTLAREVFTAFDHALEEEAQSGSEKYLEAEAYFDNLVGHSSLTEFPFPAPHQGSGKAKMINVDIVSDGIPEFCRSNGITESNFFLGVLALELSRYTREDQITLTTVSSGRADTKLSNLIGMFVKTLPVAINIQEDIVIEMIKEVQNRMFITMEQDIFPFTRMAEKYGLVPQINYVYEGGVEQDLYLGDECATLNFLNTDKVKFPFGVMIFPVQGGYSVSLEFDDSLYQETDIKRFGDIFVELANRISKNAYKSISEISLVEEEKEYEVIKISRGKELDYDRSLTLVDLFREQVRKSPDSIAVVFEERKLTYSELDLITDKLAKKLISSGVRREKVVGIFIDRSEYMVIYPLAVMKAGGAYMPLDLQMPPERLNFILKDAAADHLLTEDSLVRDSIPDFRGEIICIGEISGLVINNDIVLPKPASDDMFVLLYTSGSTGTPKGCVLEHRNIVNFCKWYVEDFNITHQDRSVAYANFAFDAHMMDIFPMLTVGASVYILPSEMRMDLIRMNNYMGKNGLTIAFMTTQIGRQFAEDIENHSLRLLSIGGERLSPTKKPPYRFYNGYGPTECTLYSTFYNIESDYKSSVIGHSLSNVSNYIMDQKLQLLPVGVAGELCIGGAGVGRGYLSRDDLNKEKFIVWKGEKLYRSGDLARYNESGEIEYITRLDNQVKLRGLRIELGEIENAISGFEGISSAVTDVKMIGGIEHLIGYYTAKTAIDVLMLKGYLRESLSEFMVPATFIQLEKFPLTNNGKVNRKALPTPETGSKAEYIAPTSKTEEAICHIYSNVLTIEKVGILDNFFEIGGSSMSAIRAVIQIINLGYNIKYGDLFKLKNPQAVAKFLSDHEGNGDIMDKVELEDLCDYNYSSINQLLDKNKPDLWENFHMRDLGDVLLTGATGYLGIHILKELIDNESGKIYCLVRSKGSLTPMQRMKSQLMYYFSKTFDETFDSRIIPVDGDITNVETLKSLKGKGVSTVFNCAASVKHYETGDELDKINIGGVVNLISFCKDEGARLIQISTRSTFGLVETAKLDNQTLIDESKLYLGQKIDNKYVLTKFKAERYLLQAVCEGMDGKIMRVGNLMGRHSDGEFQINFRSNAFVNMLKSYKVMGMFPLSQLISPLEISPVDCTAKAVVSLSKTTPEVTILHAYNNYRLNMANVIFAMQQYGFGISLVSDKVFKLRFDELMQDRRKSVYLSGLLHYTVGDKLVEMPDKNDFTTTLLYKNGIRWPLASDDYSIKLIGMLDGLGFFDEN